MPERDLTTYRRRQHRWLYPLIAAACLAAAFAAWQLLAVPRVAAVTPGPGTFVKSPRPILILDVRGLGKLSEVRVLLDGEDVTAAAQRRGDRMTLTAGDLADGVHTVAFRATSSNLFRHEVRKDWRFTVDTVTPTLHLDGSADEGHINAKPATFTGSTESFATVTVTSGKVAATGQADASGAYGVSIDLPDGPSTVTVTTTDQAGNTLTKVLAVFVDAEPPTLEGDEIAKTIGRASLKFKVSAHDQLGPPQLRAELDGGRVTLTGTASHAVLTAGDLAQGRHKLVVTAADRGGNVVTIRRTFVVDSTEHFGTATLWPGARGDDVRELQRRLKDNGVFTGTRNGVFDKRTEAAVEAYQEKCGLTVDGLVGDAVLTALSGEIIVDLSELRLYLYRGGDLIVSFPVAAGQAAFPTPTGTFFITSKTKNPTWYPPDSEWAKDSKPIPPGIENPLGTRWMGTSASGVGIHGTPDSGSIGTYASHGCIRMRIPDVEALFDRVSIGMRVVIRK